MRCCKMGKFWTVASGGGKVCFEDCSGPVWGRHSPSRLHSAWLGFAQLGLAQIGAAWANSAGLGSGLARVWPGLNPILVSRAWPGSAPLGSAQHAWLSPGLVWNSPAWLTSAWLDSVRSEDVSNFVPVLVWTDGWRKKM